MRDANEVALWRLVPDDEVRSIYLFRWVDSLGLGREGFIEVFPVTNRLISSPIANSSGWLRENVVQELLRYLHPEGFSQEAVCELKAQIADGMLAIALADEHVHALAC